MSSAASSKTTPAESFLDGDDPVRGQEYVCLSFISPEKVLKNKDIFFFSKFLNYYALDYKIRATESFLHSKVRELQGVLSDVLLDLQNEELSQRAKENKDVADTLKTQTDRLTKLRETLKDTTAADLEKHVKENISDFRETEIQKEFEKFMYAQREKLEAEFQKEHPFRSTVRGLKVRGAYATLEQAQTRARQLSKKDPLHNVYVGTVGEWMPWDPEPEDIDDQSYQLDELNKLMNAYKENAAKRDAFYEEDKRQKMAEAAAAAKAAKEKIAAEKALADGTVAEPVEEKKGITFGAKGEEHEFGQAQRDMFDSMTADIALQRKTEASSESGQDTIQHS